MKTNKIITDFECPKCGDHKMIKFSAFNAVWLIFICLIAAFSFAFIPVIGWFLARIFTYLGIISVLYGFARGLVEIIKPELTYLQCLNCNNVTSRKKLKKHSPQYSAVNPKILNPKSEKSYVYYFNYDPDH